MRSNRIKALTYFFYFYFFYSYFSYSFYSYFFYTFFYTFFSAFLQTFFSCYSLFTCQILYAWNKYNPTNSAQMTYMAVASMKST